MTPPDPTPTPTTVPCTGPIVWFDANPSAVEADAGALPAALLECAACGYLIVTGNYHDDAHQSTDLLREGMAS